MIKVKLEGFDKLARDLKEMPKAFGHASRNVLNTVAFEVRQVWERGRAQEFQIRNTFVARSVKVNKAKGTDIAAMSSEVGTPLEFMAVQEEGGFSYGPIPTTSASGEATRGKPPRKKVVRRNMYLGVINIAPTAVTGSRKIRNLITIRRAVKAGKKLVQLDMRKGPGIYRLLGGQKPRLDLVYDLRSKAHRVKPTHTLAKAVAKVEQQLPRIMRDEVLDQIKRRRLWQK